VRDEDWLGIVDDPGVRAEQSAEALVQGSLDRIAASEPTINAFITVRAERALAEARGVDEGGARRAGPLAGLPVAVKDNIDVARTRGTAGSAFWADRVPDRDAEAVRRLRAAGAVVVGKTALHEFAYGVTTNNPHYGPARNPWDPSRIPGGSSGGSGAALGADACLLALGTDTGGSVRIPAALNGVSALRPTFGAISTRGAFPVSASLDTVGPMARAMTDVAALFEVLAGFDPADPWAVEHPLAPAGGPANDLAGVRIGLPREFFFEGVEPDIERAVRAGADGLAALGADVREISVPGTADAVATANALIRAEALSVHAERMATAPERFGEDVRRRLDLGREVTGVEVALALRRMREWRAEMLATFAGVDLVLTPTTNTVAPPVEGSEMIETTARLTRFTYAWSLASLPAVSVPCGTSAGGLPIGMQLAAAPWHDRIALRAGIAFQGATDWHRRRPPLALPAV
jgi:aspartyl-tRNA(Asn)/glutamyl-tRNA(Gln) amidotransferase subunit A